MAETLLALGVHQGLARAWRRRLGRDLDRRADLGCGSGTPARCATSPCTPKMPACPYYPFERIMPAAPRPKTPRPSARFWTGPPAPIRDAVLLERRRGAGGGRQGRQRCPKGSRWPATADRQRRGQIQGRGAGPPDAWLTCAAPPESWASLPFFTTHWPALRDRLATAPAWQPADPFRALAPDTRATRCAWSSSARTPTPRRTAPPGWPSPSRRASPPAIRCATSLPNWPPTPARPAPTAT
jgi:hypothetical protein